jgi:hypothetical protein
MNNTNIPVQSMQALIISMVSAVVLAFIILITIVGPAEYGIDPTGFGKTMGLTVLAKPAQQDIKAAITCPVGKKADWDNIVVITIPAASGLEYKFHLEQGAAIEYQWDTDGTSLYFDFHGEPAGNTTGYFKSYQEATNRFANGRLQVPFTGTHGWYWKNDSAKPVKVTLRTSGQYTIKGLI